MLHLDTKMTEKSCCTNQQIIKEGKDDFKISFDTLSFEQQTFIAAYTYSYISLFVGTESEEVPFEDYPRPFVKRDVQVLHQTFLIWLLDFLNEAQQLRCSGLKLVFVIFCST